MSKLNNQSKPGDFEEYPPLSKETKVKATKPTGNAPIKINLPKQQLKQNAVSKEEMKNDDENEKQPNAGEPTLEDVKEKIKEEISLKSISVKGKKTAIKGFDEGADARIFEIVRRYNEEERYFKLTDDEDHLQVLETMWYTSTSKKTSSVINQQLSRLDGKILETRNRLNNEKDPELNNLLTAKAERYMDVKTKLADHQTSAIDFRDFTLNQDFEKVTDSFAKAVGLREITGHTLENISEGLTVYQEKDKLYSKVQRVDLISFMWCVILLYRFDPFKLAKNWGRKKALIGHVEEFGITKELIKNGMNLYTLGYAIVQLMCIRSVGSFPGNCDSRLIKIAILQKGVEKFKDKYFNSFGFEGFEEQQKRYKEVREKIVVVTNQNKKALAEKSGSRIIFLQIDPWVEYLNAWGMTEVAFKQHIASLEVKK